MTLHVRVTKRDDSISDAQRQRSGGDRCAPQCGGGPLRQSQVRPPAHWTLLQRGADRVEDVACFFRHEIHATSSVRSVLSLGVLVAYGIDRPRPRNVVIRGTNERRSESDSNRRLVSVIRRCRSVRRPYVRPSDCQSGDLRSQFHFRSFPFRRSLSLHSTLVLTFPT